MTPVRLVGMLLGVAACLSPPASQAAVGAPDRGFGQDGRVRLAFPGQRLTAGDVAVQTDDRILVGASRSGPGGGGFVLARYLPDGSADPAFGDAGVVTTSVGEAGGELRDLVLQSDGRILAVGGAVVGGRHVLALARYAIDGSLDESFGSRGVAVLDRAGVGVTAALLPDGSILALDARSTLARLRSNGSLDPAYADGGFAPAPHPPAYATDLALLPDGGAVAVGAGADAHGGYDLAIRAVRPDGAPDARFERSYVGGPGQGVAVVPEGIVVAASNYCGKTFGDFPHHCEPALIRLGFDGAPDPSFGSRGYAYGPCHFSPNGLATMPDGGFAGACRTGFVRYRADAVLARHTGVCGFVRSRASSVAVQRDGNVVTVGNEPAARRHDADPAPEVTVARYLMSPSEEARRPDATIAGLSSFFVEDQLSFQLRPSARARYRARLLLTPTRAKRLGIPRTVASGSGIVPSCRRSLIELRARRAAARRIVRLKRGQSIPVQLRVFLRNRHGGRTRVEPAVLETGA